MEDNKAKRIYFEEDYDEIIHPSYRNVFGNEPDAPIVYGESTPDEEIALTGALVYVLACIGALVIIAILFYCLYYK